MDFLVYKKNKTRQNKLNKSKLNKTQLNKNKLSKIKLDKNKPDKIKIERKVECTLHVNLVTGLDIYKTEIKAITNFFLCF